MRPEKQAVKMACFFLRAISLKIDFKSFAVHAICGMIKYMHSIWVEEIKNGEVFGKRSGAVKPM